MHQSVCRFDLTPQIYIGTRNYKQQNDNE